MANSQGGKAVWLVVIAGMIVTALGVVVSLGNSSATTLGPKDGRDLDSADLDRVQVGDVAPDFSLEAYAGDTVTLSDFRENKNVVLVFYRGHW